MLLAASLRGTRRLVVTLGQYGLVLGPARRALIEPAGERHEELPSLLVGHYGRCLWEAGLMAGRCGNLPVRSRLRNVIYVTPRAVNKARLSAAEVQRVAGGEPCAGR